VVFGIDATSPAMAHIVGEDPEQLHRVIQLQWKLPEESGLHAANLVVVVVTTTIL